MCGALADEGLPMRPGIVPPTTREPFLSFRVTKSRGLRPIGAESDGVSLVSSPSCLRPPAASALGREGWANRRCLAGISGGRTFAALTRTARAWARRERRGGRGGGRAARGAGGGGAAAAGGAGARVGGARSLGVWRSLG